MLARITREEHHRLVGIYTHHAELYDPMLKSPVAKLEALGRLRYKAAAIVLREV